MSKHERRESKKHEAMERVRSALRKNKQKRTQSRSQAATQEMYTPRQSFLGKPAGAGAMNVRGGARKKS